MSDHRNLFKHSRNYLFANLATKALSFVSIPVYTRLLTVEEYGVVGVFTSVVGIATVLFSLNAEVAVGRYFYDAENRDDFKRFVGTTLFLCFLIFCLTSSLFVFLIPRISESLSFTCKFTFFLLPLSFYQIVYSIFEQIYNPLLESKKIAIVSSVQAYLGFVIIALCMFMLHEERYYGYAYGSIITMFVMIVYLYRQIRPYCKFAFKRSHVKYILNYCLPYIPYSLSSVILIQFSRVIMGNSQGYSLTGAYTLTTNTAALMMMVIGITHSAWNPYFFRYMNNKDTASIDSDYNLIWRITLLITLGIASYGYEIALVLSKGGEYLKTMYILPLLVLGYVFYQWAYVYLRNTAYAKRTIWMALSVFASGISNVVFNAWLIPLYGEVGAAMATVSSFFILMLVGLLVNHYIIKEYAPRLSLFLGPFVLLLPFLVASFILQRADMSFLICFVLKMLLLVLLSLILFWKYKEKIKVLLTTHISFIKH